MFYTPQVAGINCQFTTHGQLRDFFYAAALATSPLAKSVVFNGSTNAGKSLGWDSFREAIMDNPKLSSEMFSEDDCFGWRASELWKGKAKTDGSPLSILNFSANLTDSTGDVDLGEQLDQIQQSMFSDSTLRRLNIERPRIEAPADLILISNSGYANPSMCFTIYDTSEPNKFGEPPRYIPWQRDLTWEIFDPEIANKKEVKKLLSATLSR